MKELLKINEVAKFLGLNQKTIRYYEEYGLFTPQYIDPNTKYRYYSLDSINKLAYIMDLRACGLTMQLIKGHLDGSLNTNDLLIDLLERKKKLDEFITIIEKKLNPEKEYNVTVLNTMPFKACTKEIIAQDLSDLYVDLREFATECITKTIMNKSNVSFIQFLEYSPSLKNLKFKLGVPVKAGYTEEINLGKVLHTYHTGSLLEKQKAYNSLKLFAYENNYKIIGEGVEFYHKSYKLDSTNEDLVIEICLPIE